MLAAKPTSARASAVAEDGDDRKFKVLGKKKVTNIDLCTLTPEWRKKFVLSVPAKLILQALHAACKAQGVLLCCGSLGCFVMCVWYDNRRFSFA